MILKNKRKHNLEKSDLLLYHLYNLGNPAFCETIKTISWRYGYTHDLAWSLIGLDECINWNDWKSHYYGDMLEVIIDKLKENDEAVLNCIREMIQGLS